MKKHGGEDEYTPTDDEADTREPIVPLRRYHEKEPIRDADRREHQRKKEQAEAVATERANLEELHPGEDRRRRRDEGDLLPENEEKRMRFENKKFLGRIPPKTTNQRQR